jgi:hypothetical protein
MVKKVTFTLDDVTIRRLQTAAEGLGKPKSEVVREAIADYHERLGRLSDEEKRRMLRVVDEMLPLIPRRAAAAVDREIEQVRAARRSGRGGTGR